MKKHSLKGLTLAEQVVARILKKRLAGESAPPVIIAVALCVPPASLLQLLRHDAAFMKAFIGPPAPSLAPPPSSSPTLRRGTDHRRDGPR